MPKTGLSLLVGYLRKNGYLFSMEVENAMLGIDRAHFIPEKAKDFAYADMALPIGYGQTISAPSVVSFMLERLGIEKGMKVLEVGTGSGYNCALISALVGKQGSVVSMDSSAQLSALAKENLKNAGVDTGNIRLVVGDGGAGYRKEAPYDRIIVTAAMPYFSASHPLAKQLAQDGKLIAPVGGKGYQDLVVYENRSGRMEKVMPVMFVPLTGKYGFQE